MDPARTKLFAQKQLLLLLPIILLAITAFCLDPHVLGPRDHFLRDYLTFSSRICFPCLFVLSAALLAQTRERITQLFIVSLNYVILLFALGLLRPSALLNPSLCVIAAASSIIALRSDMDTPPEYLSAKPHLSGFLRLCSAIVLPLGLFFGLITVLKQLESFVIFTVSEGFGSSFMSMFFSPIYLILQTLGFHTVITGAVLINYADSMVNAFINSIIVTNFIALPILLIGRSFLVDKSMRLFLTLLSLTALLTASVGPCISLIYVLILFMLPGTYALLIICSICFFLCSYLLQVPALTNINNLYHPDIDLLAAVLLSFLPSTKLLYLCGAALPLLLLALTALIKKERLTTLRQRRSISKSGLTLKDNPSLDLSVIVLLRALGGLSNIAAVSYSAQRLSITVHQAERCQTTLLATLTIKKPHYTKVSRTYLLDLGDLTKPVGLRLTRLSADNPTRTAPTISTRNFKITPLPHLGRSASP